MEELPIDTKDRPVSPVNGQPVPEGREPWKPGEEAREIGRRGGIKSGESRRARKTLREELLLILDDLIPDKQGNMVPIQKAMSTSLIKQAINGSVRAYEVIRDTIGEKPVEKVEQMIDVDYRKSVEYVKDLMKGTEE